MASPVIPTMSVPDSSRPVHPLRPPSILITPSIFRSKTVLSSHNPLTDSPISPFLRALNQDPSGLTPPSNARTRAPFKPRSAAKGSGSYQLRQFAEATLGSGSLRKAVRLPDGEDLNEWLAVNGMLVVVRSNPLASFPSELTRTSSGGLLQPNKSSLWRYYGVLLPALLSRDESDGRVCIYLLTWYHHDASVHCN